MSKNIYDNVKIILDWKTKKFDVVNMTNLQDWHRIAIGVENLETATAIHKAYCDGFYDGQHSSKENK